MVSTPLTTVSELTLNAVFAHPCVLLCGLRAVDGKYPSAMAVVSATGDVPGHTYDSITPWTSLILRAFGEEIH